jgi:3-phosphoinositide dependent protein kinase-1
MQDVDPSKRPGAGPDGYSSLKKHPFFRGIDWKNLRKTRPPKLAIDPNVFLLHISIKSVNLLWPSSS